MRTQNVFVVALITVFGTPLTSVWVQAGSPTSAAQAEASNKATSQKKGTNTSAQGGSIRSSTVDQSANNPTDNATHMGTGRRIWKPIRVVKETDKSSATVVTTKPADQASPKLAVIKPADKSSSLKQGVATPLSVSSTPAPAIKKGTTSKR